MEGVSDQNIALELLSEKGFDNDIIDTAKAISDNLVEQEHKINTHLNTEEVSEPVSEPASKAVSPVQEVPRRYRASFKPASKAVPEPVQGIPRRYRAS